MIRELLVELLRRQERCEVVGEARSGTEAIELAGALRPDVLLLDISLPGLDGVAVTRLLSARLPQLKIIALTVHDAPEMVDEMFAAGARGYVTKFSALDELVGAIGVVLEGRTYVSPSIALAGAQPGRGAPRLGRRERQVLALVAGGKHNPEIAAQLGISVGTVETHRRNIMRKLGLHSVAELTRYALREGLVSL